MKPNRWNWLWVLTLPCLAACSDTNDPADDTREVILQTSVFSPANVTIAVGQSVRWVNRDAFIHNVTPNNPQQAGAWPAFELAAATPTSATASAVRLNTAGVFDYNCTLHPGMNGRITVQ